MMRTRTAPRTLALFVFVSIFTATACADSVRPGTERGEDAKATIPQEKLLEACRATKADFHPLTSADVADAKAVLLDALARLDRRLSEDGANGEAWRKYLRLGMLREELRGDKQPDPTRLTNLLKRFRSGDEGLELVWFLDVERALHNYIATAGAVANPHIRAAYETQMDKLAVALESYLAKPTTEDALTISEAVRWLQQARQAPRLVEAIQQHFVQRNVQVEIAAEIVGAGIAEPVDDVTDVRDCILGTSVFGTARTRGQTKVELAPSSDFGVIDTLFFGTAISDNVGYNGPVTIFSESESRLAAVKRLWMTEAGLASHPAAARAETSIDIRDIRSRKGRRFIERMAWRRAGKQQALAECIASGRAEERLAARVDARAAEALEKANQQYIEKFRRPFLERKLFPQLLAFSTTRQALTLVGLQAGGGKLAAPTPPPPVVAGADISLRLHESAINNLAFDALAGRTVYEEKVQATATDLLGRLPDKMKGDEDGVPWAITFAPRQPISVSFADGGFKITLRGVNFYKGKEYPDPMNITAAYKIEKTERGIRAVRQGEIEAFPPDFVPGSGQQLGGRQHVIRKLLERRFAKVFEPEFLGEGLELPGRWKAAGKLLPIQVECRDGWLVVAWKRAA